MNVVFDASGVAWRLLRRRGHRTWSEVKAVVPEYDARGRLFRIRMIVFGAGLVFGQPHIKLEPIRSYLVGVGCLSEQGGGSYTGLPHPRG